MNHIKRIFAKLVAFVTALTKFLFLLRIPKFCKAFLEGLLLSFIIEKASAGP